MRFTPTAFFNQGSEPCVSSSAVHCISSSVFLGSVEYDVYLFTSSVQSGGGDVESGELYIHDGWTKRAIVAVVGGGGGGSSDGRGGGSGGILAYDNVSLYSGTYYVQIGQGALGTERNTAGLPFSGDNGSDSRFYGQALDFTAGGGEGGNLGGLGGKSGLVNGQQFIATSTGGAGSSQNATGSQGSPGHGIYTAGNNQLFLAGGGGPGILGATTSSLSYNWGGGQKADARGFGIDGSGGQFYESAYRFGGGGTGGQYYDNIDLKYRSSKGGSGCVLVAIPKNLCTSSLYQENPNIVSDGLSHSYNMNNIKSMGKDLWGTQIKDLMATSNLNLTSSGQLDAYFSNNNSGKYAIYFDSETYDGLGSNAVTTSPVGFNGRRKDYLLGRLENLNATQDFTIEIIGKLPDTIANNQDRNIVALADSPSSFNFQLVVDDNNNNVSIRNNSVESTKVTTDESLAQHVITYDSGIGQFKYYVNNVPKITFNSTTTSSLDFPYVTFGDTLDYQSSINKATYFREMRFYNKVLSSQEIAQNYSASFDNQIILGVSSTLQGVCTSPTTTPLYYDINTWNGLQIGATLYTNISLLTPVSNSYIISGSDVFVISGSDGIVSSQTICSNTVALASGSDSSSACNSGTFINYYHTGSFGVGTTIYSDFNRTTTIPDNFYKQGTINVFETTAGVVGTIVSCSVDCTTITFRGNASGGTVTYYDCNNVFQSATLNRLNVFNTCYNAELPVTLDGTTSYTTGSAC